MGNSNLFTPIITSLAISLGLTLLFESIFFFIVGKRNKKDLLLVILVNTLTNPIVVLFYWIAYYCPNLNQHIALIPLEIFAILTEGFIYSRYAQSINRPYLFSLAANLFSFSLGFILQLIVR